MTKTETEISFGTWKFNNDQTKLLIECNSRRALLRAIREIYNIYKDEIEAL